MSILLTGAHGVGKTSTAVAINATDPKLKLLPSVSRASPHATGTIQNQRHLMREVWRRVFSDGQFVHERTPLDVCAYTSLHKIRAELPSQEANVSEFYRRIRDDGAPIFYFPICFALEDDGVRPGRREQVEVDRYILASLEGSGVAFHAVPAMSAVERADFILERSTKG